MAPRSADARSCHAGRDRAAVRRGACGCTRIRRRCRTEPAPPASSARSWSTRWAAGGYVGRASGRDFDARRDLPYAPYGAASFEVPVLTAGDVNARVWIRIREIEQSIKLLKRLARRPAGRPDAHRLAVRGRKRRRRRADRGVPRRRAGLGAHRRRPGHALPCPRRVVVPMAAAGGRDREQHRRRLPALQQIVQLLVFGARSLMRTLLLARCSRGR